MGDRKPRGSIKPAADFNAENIVSRLRKAMRGIGTDEQVVIDILTGHSNSQRQIIKKKYKTIYGRILIDDIKAELGGHFEDVCIALLTPLAEYIVDCLYSAIKETDENCVKEILVSLEFMDLCYVKSIFQEKYNADLSELLASGGQQLLSVLAERPDSSDDANADAQYLWTEGLSKSCLYLLMGRSKFQLEAILAAFLRISGSTLQEATRLEVTRQEATRQEATRQEATRQESTRQEATRQEAIQGREVLLARLDCVANRVAFFASQLHEALKGPQTDDATIIRILVSRSEVDLTDIYEWYHMKYDVDLCEAIYAETSGDYRTILLKILETRPRFSTF